MRMLSWRAMVVIGLLLWSIACGGGDDDGDAGDTAPTSNDVSGVTASPSGSIAPTSGTAGTTATSVDAEPTATDGAATAATPTATQASSDAPPTSPPTTDGAPLTGEATRDDGSDDLQDADGAAAEATDPAVDLARVTLQGDGSALTVTFEMHQLLPDPLPAGITYSWDIIIFGDDPARGHSIIVAYSDMLGWTTTVGPNSASLPEPPQRGERTLTVSIPAELLTNVEGPFTWIASTSVTTISATAITTYNDYVPDGAGFNAQGERVVPFPD